MNYVEQVILLTRLGYGLRDIVRLAEVDEPEVNRILKSPGKARHAYRTELEDKRAALAARLLTEAAQARGLSLKLVKKP